MPAPGAPSGPAPSGAVGEPVRAWSPTSAAGSCFERLHHASDVPVAQGLVAGAPGGSNDVAEILGHGHRHRTAFDPQLDGRVGEDDDAVDGHLFANATVAQPLANALDAAGGIPSRVAEGIAAEQAEDAPQPP